MNRRRLFRLDVRQGQIEQQVDDELQFHIASRVDDLTQGGMPREDAMAVALREFGDVSASGRELAKVDARRHSRRDRLEWLNDAVQDARVALRGFAKRPAFTAIVLLTIALAIGANGAIFSVVEAALVRPLPYRDAQNLVHLWETKNHDATDRSEASYPDFLDWRNERAVFANVEGYDETNVTVGGDDGAERIRGGRVSPGFFDMLGARAHLGRTFRQDDDVLDTSPSVVVAFPYWQRHGADSGIVGRKLLVDGRPTTIIGVLPKTFRFAPAGDAELWFTLGRSAATRGERFNHWINVVARLKDRVPIEAARAGISVTMTRLAAAYPESNDGRGALLVPLQDEIVGPVRPVLIALLGAVLLVLLIACANVTSLMLARSLERAPERALRTALGASRARIARQLIMESLLLALGGGILGVFAAWAGIHALTAAMPAALFEQLPQLRDVQLNVSVVGFTLGITLLAGTACSITPVLLAWRGASSPTIRLGARGGTAGRQHQRLRDMLVTAEIACALVLVIGASLMARSMRQLLEVNPGYVTEHVVTGRVALAGPAYREGARQQQYFEQLILRVRNIPGIQSVGAVTNPPLQGGGTNTFRVEGQPEPPAASRPEATMRGTAGDYFRTIGIPLVEGRALNNGDDSASTYVVVISKALAQKQFGNQSAVGSRVRFYAFPESAWTIVGVAGDVKTASLDAAAAPTIYYSHLQAAENRMSVVAKATGDPIAVLVTLSATVKQMDASMPLYAVGTIRDQLLRSSAVTARQYPLVLIGMFALTALLLSVIGVYGVIAYAVVQRTREFAVRIALGATAGEVRTLVLRRGAMLALAGMAVGVPAALVLTRFMRTLVFGVSTNDVVTYVAALLGVGCVALAASCLPARQATRVNPARALRGE